MERTLFPPTANFFTKTSNHLEIYLLFQESAIAVKQVKQRASIYEVEGEIVRKKLRAIALLE